MGLRDQILNVTDIEAEVVDVPEWDAKIELRGMSGADRAAFTENTRAGEARSWVLPELIIACAYDPDSGEKLFERGDRDMLNTKNARVLDRLFTVAARLSGIGQQEELVGKSEDPPTSDGS